VSNTDYLTMRLEPELRQRARELADLEDRPLTNWTRRVIAQAVAAHDREQATERDRVTA
jgi:predicted transcriptional regulator